MSDQNQKSALPEWMTKTGQINVLELSDRLMACTVLSEMDYDAQLFAIHNLIQRNRETDSAMKQEIKALEAHARQQTGTWNEIAVNEVIGRYHESVYQDAAHSMAATGMLAPLVESIFFQAFQGIRHQFYQKEGPPGIHARWTQPAEDQWDCHYVWKNGRRDDNLVDGIMQLAEATGLKSYLPKELKRTMDALFGYRNKMFHRGFEWPMDERERFVERMNSWPKDWFEKSMKGEFIWIVYVTQTFISHVLETIDKILDGIGAYCKHMYLLDSVPPNT